MAEHDQSTLHKAVAGDTDALTRLLQEHGPAIRASIRGHIPAKWRSVLSEDDVMQQTYTDAFLDIGDFDPDGDGAFSGWLCTLAQCNLRDALRMLEAVKRGGRKNRVELDQPIGSADALVNALSSSGTSPSGRAAGIEARALLDRAMAALPETYRQVVQLYDLDALDIETVAQRLNRSPGATYMLRARAHHQLQKLLGAATRFFTDGA